MRRVKQKGEENRETSECNARHMQRDRQRQGHAVRRSTMDYTASVDRGGRERERDRKREGKSVRGGLPVYSRYPFGTDRFCCFVIFYVSQELASIEQNRTCPLKYVIEYSGREREGERKRGVALLGCCRFGKARRSTLHQY